MNNRKITSYLLYALGEILLVVMGILIAVQIDNWNDSKKNLKNEQQLLNNLHQEFLDNEATLDSVLRRHYDIQKTISHIMGLINSPTEQLAQYNIDSLLYISIDYTDYSPGQSVISELISAGKMQLISSEKIRMLIFRWQSAVEEKREGWNTLDEFSQKLVMPYLTTHASMRNIDYYGIGRPNGKSNFTFSNHALFNQKEFENHMDNQYWGVTNYLDKLEKLKLIVGEILVQTAPQS